MKIEFLVDNILPALQVVSQVVNKKNTMPILDNVVLKVEDECVYFTGSDAETQITIPAPLSSPCENATLCVNAADFVKILSRLKGHQLTLEFDKNVLHGNYEGGTFDMMCGSADEYPWLTPNNNNIHSFTAQSSIISNAINSTLFAIDNDEIRPILTGVYMGFNNGLFECVGTNGRCLVKYSNNRVLGENRTDLVLPKKPASILKSMFATSDDINIECVYNDKNVTFSNSAFIMTCRLIEGRYPNFESVIPRDNGGIAYANRNKLIDTLSRISMFAPTMSELVIMEFANDKLTVSCEDIDFSKSGKETINCAYQGKPMKIGFKYSIIDAVLRNLHSEDVSFKLKSPSTAAIIEPYTHTEDDEVNVLSLVMPMKID